MRGALSTLARGRAAGGMVVSVLGDTFADVVCRPLERLPAWGTVRQVDYNIHKATTLRFSMRGQQQNNINNNNNNDNTPGLLANNPLSELEVTPNPGLGTRASKYVCSNSCHLRRAGSCAPFLEAWRARVVLPGACSYRLYTSSTCAHARIGAVNQVLATGRGCRPQVNRQLTALFGEYVPLVRCSQEGGTLRNPRRQQRFNKQRCHIKAHLLSPQPTSQQNIFLKECRNCPRHQVPSGTINQGGAYFTRSLAHGSRKC